MSGVRQPSGPGAPVPPFLYGTAWKEEETERLTTLALHAGFRGIDTANQRRHYAVAAAIAGGAVRRDDLFLQTKFTYPRGQDHRLPYDPAAAPASQVRQSFASSLEHLHVERLDSYLLHGPTGPYRLSAADREVWGAMEELHAGGKTRFLGISNVSLAQLEELLSFAAAPPAFVQNRCFAHSGWDREVRAFCRANGVVYQGFSLLTANAAEIGRPEMRALASRLGATPAQVVFRFARQAGMLPLTGTSDAGHMRQDLASERLELSAGDLRLVETLGLAG